MKITIATGPWLPVPALQGGAIPRLWQGLAEEFKRRGHDVCIFARSFPEQPAQEVINGVRYLRWGGSEQSLSIKKDLAKDFVYAGRAVRRLPRADILVTNAFWLPVFAGIFRTVAGKIVVNANRFPKGQFRLYSRAARIAAASTAIMNEITRQAPSLASRTKVFPNPIDTNLMKPPAGRRGMSPQKTLLFVGRLHPEKGIHLLIEAFRRLAVQHKVWRLRLVGPIEEYQGGGGPAYQKRLFDLSSDLSVEFTGPVFDSARLGEVYRNADLFCYPSLAEKGESFGVAPLEAMATGLVPVVSDLACFRDFICDGKTGFYFDHRAADPTSELTACLKHAIADWPATLAMGEQAGKVAQHFSYTQIADAYLADFEELIYG